MTINNITRQYILAELLENNLLFHQFRKIFPDKEPYHVKEQLDYLVKARCIILSNAGIYSITDYGKELIKNHIQKLSRYIQEPVNSEL